MRSAKIITSLIVLVLAIAACNVPASATAIPTNNTIISGVSVVSLTKVATNSQDIFSNAGQVINYEYSVSNTGAAALAGPVVVLDNKISTVNCPDLTTIGNLDAFLDPNETLVCTASYSITQADLDAGSVVNTSTATLNGVASDQVSATVMLSPQTRILSLTKTANPTTYNQVGQVINYTYTIQNTGSVSLGPAQFTVTDNRFATSINCGSDGTVLAPSQTIACSAAYTITQADMSAASVTNSATASGGGADPSQPATTTVTNTAPSSGLTPGSTVLHTVERGEWMIQIGRCYGADYNALRRANLQIANPRSIKPGEVITVPNIGSVGRIYGKPCIGYHLVQSGDSWNSIAQKYNADYAVLLEANPNVTLANGICVRVPLNSAGGATPAQPALESCPGGSSTGTTSPQTPIHITLPAGSNSIVLSKVLGPTERVRYSLTASQNQILDITVIAPANEVALAVYDPNGTTLKALDTNLTWSQSLTLDGDYIIELAGVAGISNKNITLQITITNPTS